MTRTVWLGPVASYQVHAPTSDLFIPCVGAAGTPICEDLDVAPLLVSKGVPSDQPIILRGFSAGGDAIKKFLKDPAARDRTVAVVLHDATYQQHGSDEGFFAYATEAAQNLPGRIFVATTSSGGSSRGISDSASMESIRQEVERRTGQKFQVIQAPWAPKPPVKAWQLGQTVLLDFGAAFTHGEHATVLAVPVFDSVVSPMLTTASAVAPSPPVPVAPTPHTSDPVPVPWALPTLVGRPIWPAILVAAGVGVFLYAITTPSRG